MGVLHVIEVIGIMVRISSFYHSMPTFSGMLKHPAAECFAKHLVINSCPMSKASRQQWAASSGSQVLWATSAFGPWHWCQSCHSTVRLCVPSHLLFLAHHFPASLTFCPYHPQPKPSQYAWMFPTCFVTPSRHRNFFCTLNANLVQSVLALGARMLTYFHCIYLFICFPMIDIFSSSPLSVWAPQSSSVPGFHSIVCENWCHPTLASRFFGER